MDYRVKGQLSPSSVDQSKKTIRFNQRSRFIENKSENI